MCKYNHIYRARWSDFGYMDHHVERKFPFFGFGSLVLIRTFWSVNHISSKTFSVTITTMQQFGKKAKHPVDILFFLTDSPLPLPSGALLFSVFHCLSKAFILLVPTPFCKRYANLHWESFSLCEVKLFYCFDLLDHKGHIHPPNVWTVSEPWLYLQGALWS